MNNLSTNYDMISNFSSNCVQKSHIYTLFLFYVYFDGQINGQKKG